MTDFEDLNLNCYSNAVAFAIENEFPADPIDPGNQHDLVKFCAYQSLVKYVGRHVSTRLPQGWGAQHPLEGHDQLVTAIRLLLPGLQQKGHTLPTLFHEMVVTLATGDGTTMVLPDEVYNAVFEREVLGLERLHARTDKECRDCLIRTLCGVGYIVELAEQPPPVPL